jgi:hypothetical protein
MSLKRLCLLIVVLAVNLLGGARLARDFTDGIVSGLYRYATCHPDDRNDVLYEIDRRAIQIIFTEEARSPSGFALRAPKQMAGAIWDGLTRSRA